uniref:DUF1640 domain-containing protein n=1 Tax=Aureoumbra lagunensis TaxID=44058 RepID=A0A7S3JX19_9STRA|mmetsp:Transcript_20035/g.30496  ORF Transcript_20035/g.30496 Transcript_20035/m.30496 type:complete len:230 (-) Transcript_20035:425-1114(-)|eukprot:CAMPEP_0197309954 /NCGR_PEP_ID=MMETSP0891-20130614/8577_1 /TAXON_ID=44058 ORGANISM="Aureoumbra lagunensis, Strain CCMP1510" /NCGR_SAMPLE_ID=MMETSP0891 /ASSEMBLY_ACC=CAM_ASM_000534 /LENGTH=229 /DNA_ID=CAMNT_0042795353 /DNA_START=63 /DNA_END=752 /DNA_ORIENTATION=+
MLSKGRLIGALVARKSPPLFNIGERGISSRSTWIGLRGLSSTSSTSSLGGKLGGKQSDKQMSKGPKLTSGVDALRELEQASLSRSQSEALVRVLSNITEDIMERQRDFIATTADIQGLRSELNEKVFNSTLKYDLAQRHLRELMERDIRNLRAELRTEERKDYADIIAQVQSLEKNLLKKESEDDRRIERIVTEQAHLETRILRYIFGSLFAGITGILTIGLAAARLII